MSARRVNSGTAKEDRPKAVSLTCRSGGGSGDAKCCAVLAATVGQEAETAESKDHHRPDRRPLGKSTNGNMAAENPREHVSDTPTRGAGLLRFQSTVSLGGGGFPLAIARPQGSAADRFRPGYRSCGADLRAQLNASPDRVSLALTTKQKPPRSGRLSRSDRRKKIRRRSALRRSAFGDKP
jgi:hypothetical protein